MKIYLCIQSDAPMFGDTTTTVAAFLHKEHAEKYCEISEAQEEPNTYSYYIDEMEVRETFNMDLQIREYYCFCCDTEDYTEQDIADNWINNPDELYKKVGDDVIYDIIDWGNGEIHISVYSVNSFEEAKSLAIQKWRELKNDNNKN